MSSNLKISLVSIMLVATLSGLIVLVNTNSSALTRELNSKPKIDLVKLDKNYREQVKMILSRYISMEANLAESQAAEFRRQLLDLSVPGKFRQLHVSLVLAMNHRITAIKTGDLNEKSASDELITRAKAEYSWLN